MGKTKDLFKKIRDTKGTFHVKMDTIEDRNGMDLIEAEDIKKRSLQSCPTLCDPIDSSPPGFPIPGILQARTLEWVAISFSILYSSYVYSCHLFLISSASVSSIPFFFFYCAHFA